MADTKPASQERVKLEEATQEIEQDLEKNIENKKTFEEKIKFIADKIAHLEQRSSSGTVYDKHRYWSNQKTEYKASLDSNWAMAVQKEIAQEELVKAAMSIWTQCIRRHFV